MNQFVIENQGVNSYLVYTINPEDDLDSMSFGMLTNNRIKGYAQVLYTQINEVGYLKYNVSSFVSLREFISSKSNKKMIIGVFKGIVSAIQIAEEYMIDPKHIMLDMDYIYVDPSTYHIYVICVPINNKELNNLSYGTFFKDIIINTKFDQTENCNYVGQILNYVNSVSEISLASFGKLLDNLNDDNRTIAGNSASKSKVVVQNVNRVEGNAQPTKTVKSDEKIANQILTTSIPSDNKKNKTGDTKLPTDNNDSDEEKMSFLYLMNHYTKENAEKYKTQQAENKKKKQTEVKIPKSSKKTKQEAPTFAIPGVASTTQTVVQAETKQKGSNKNLENYDGQKDERAKSNSLKDNLRSNNQVMNVGPVIEGENNKSKKYVDNSSDNETTLINDNDSSEDRVDITNAYLIRKSTDECIVINTVIFRIGRDKVQNNYVVLSNRYIGNLHCHIVYENNEFYVIDNYSKNHTFVDGRQVLPGKKTCIANGQILRLANEDFEFRRN